jgi:protein TonB
VYLTFVVEKDGSVTDVRILRGIGGGCDEEAIRVIHMMPKWNPGLQINKPVRVQFNMPIKFTLHS